MENKSLEILAAENNYTLDYLSCGSPIFQVKNSYTFTSDSIHLAHFVKEEKIGVLVDLCSGSGVVGLEVVGQKEVGKAILVELQKELAACAKLSASLNTKNTEIEVINDDIKNLSTKIPFLEADVVTINPPYFKVGSGEVNGNKSKALARHEISITLKDIIKVTRDILKPNGKLYLIHLYSREQEIFKELENSGFEILNSKVLDGKSKRIIIEAKKV